MQDNPGEDKLNKAISMLQNGELSSAIVELEDFIKENPEIDKALYFLALSQYQSNLLPDAAKNIEKALHINPSRIYIKDACDIFFDNALTCTEKGDIDEAISYYEKILLLNPEDKEVISNLGKLSLEKNQLDSAAGYFLILVQLDPENTDSHIKLAKVYEKQDKVEKAIDVMLKVVQNNENSADALLYTGLLYTKLEEFELSGSYFYKSYNLQQDNPTTCFNTGLALYNANRKAESIPWYERAIELDPKLYEAHLNLGLALCSTGRYEESIKIYEKALELKPDSIEVYINMGITYIYNRDEDSAEKVYNKAYEIDPENVDSLIAQGFIRHFKNEIEKAEEFYKKALEKDSDNACVKFNLSSIRLLKGKYKEGWDLYESRFKMDYFTRPYIPKIKKPLWNGECLKDKTLYVYPEQGFGDSMMFSRFLPILAERSKKVIFKAKEPLMQLFKESDLGVELIEENIHEESLDFDYYIPIMSTARALNINLNNIPYSEGYFKPNPEQVKKYKDEYFNNNDYKVGIFWQGNQKGLINRMITLQELLPLTNIEGIKLYSFQKGYGIEQLEALPDTNIVNLGPTFNNFAYTAAAMKNLDLMVCVDTAVVHLSAGISTKTLLLLSYASEWRWLENTDHSPWYKSVEIIRQSEYKNWTPVVDELCSLIKERIKLKI